MKVKTMKIYKKMMIFKKMKVFKKMKIFKKMKVFKNGNNESVEFKQRCSECDYAN